MALIPRYRADSFIAAFLLASLPVTGALATEPRPGNFTPPPATYAIDVEHDVAIPMRDGIRLAADIYRPRGVTDKLPVVLIRTPYNKDTDTRFEMANFFAGHGYIAIVEDFRGRFRSEGTYKMDRFHREDGYDTFAWIIRQPWTTGKIGTYGCSYQGEVQLYQAPAMPPGLTAMIPQAAGAALGLEGPDGNSAWLEHGGMWDLQSNFDWFYNYGSQLYYAPRQRDLVDREANFRISSLYSIGPIMPKIDFAPILNSLPLENMFDHVNAPPNEWREWVRHNNDMTDAWWRDFNFIQRGDRIGAPALFIESWNDSTASGGLYMRAMFEKTGTTPAARNNQFIIISPASHCESESMVAGQSMGDEPLGDPRFGHMDIYLKWFDYWLKGIPNGITSMPKIQYFVIGLNQWKATDTWPVPGTRWQSFYLGGHDANSDKGMGLLSAEPNGNSDGYASDPAHPVPTLGINDFEDSKPIMDQAAVASRQDVLVYTSDPLTRGLEVTGEIDADLYVSSTAKDTDVIVKLVDVHPDGTALNVRQSGLRLRYRDGRDKAPQVMEPGKIYRVRFSIGTYSMYFKQGHRIRVQIASSDFPQYDRNLQTGGHNYDESVGVIARNTVFHSRKYPSRIILPIAPSSP